MEQRLLRHRDAIGRLIREKEALQALADRLELDVERRRKRVLDLGLIRHTLQDFARLVSFLPLEDQKELFQLLLHAVDVQPFDPESDGLPAEDGVVTTKIRARWYRVRITLYQIPGVALANRAAESSDNGVGGSPRRGKSEPRYV